MSNFYVGEEVGNTPMYGTKTLFVVGLPDAKETIETAKKNECEHIFLGAKGSFTPEVSDRYWAWESFLTGLIEAGFSVTLDVEYPAYQKFIKKMADKFPENFYPLLSINLPGILDYGPNATLKIDDRGRANNPGIWCFILDDTLNEWGFFNTWEEMANCKAIKGGV